MNERATSPKCFLFLVRTCTVNMLVFDDTPPTPERHIPAFNAYAFKQPGVTYKPFWHIPEHLKMSTSLPFGGVWLYNKVHINANTKRVVVGDICAEFIYEDRRFYHLRRSIGTFKMSRLYWLRRRDWIRFESHTRTTLHTCGNTLRVDVDGEICEAQIAVGKSLGDDLSEVNWREDYKSMHIIDILTQ